MSDVPEDKLHEGNNDLTGLSNSNHCTVRLSNCACECRSGVRIRKAGSHSSIKSGVSRVVIARDILNLPDDLVLAFPCVSDDLRALPVPGVDAALLRGMYAQMARFFVARKIINCLKIFSAMKRKEKNFLLRVLANFMRSPPPKPTMAIHFSCFTPACSIHLQTLRPANGAALRKLTSFAVPRITDGVLGEEPGTMHATVALRGGAILPPAPEVSFRPVQAGHFPQGGTEGRNMTRSPGLIF